MEDQFIHINPEQVPPSPFTQIIQGFAGLMQQNDAEKYALQKRCEEYEKQAKKLPQTCIVAEGKQKELIAIFHTIYKAGYFPDISEKDFMQRVADMLGCPGMANYSGALYNFKTAYKYDEVFDNLLKVAKAEKIG